MKSYLKSFGLMLSLLVLPMSLWAEDYQLSIFEKDNPEPKFSCWVTDKPKLSFNQAENSLTATVTTPEKQEVTIQFDQVARIDLKAGVKPTGIDVISKGVGSNILNVQFLDAQTVVVDGVADGVHAALYSLDGKSVTADIERNDGQVTFHLNALSRGVFIIRIGQQSFKIIKKS